MSNIPAVKFFVRLDLGQIISFVGRNLFIYTHEWFVCPVSMPGTLLTIAFWRRE